MDQVNRSAFVVSDFRAERGDQLVFCDARFDKALWTLSTAGWSDPAIPSIFGGNRKIGEASASSPFLRAARDSRRTPRHRLRGSRLHLH